MLSTILEGSFNCFILLIVSEEIFLFTDVNFSNLLTAVSASGNRSSSLLKTSFCCSYEQVINFSSSLKSIILTLLIPSTKTLTVPSGSFRSGNILLSHP